MRTITTLALLLLLLLLAGCAAQPRDPFIIDWDAQLAAAQRVDPPPALEPMDQPLPVPVDGTLTLSVEEAVVLALRNNRDLAVQQLTPAIAGAFEQVERGSFDAELYGEASLSRERASEVSRSTGDRFSVTGDDALIEAGVRQRLSTGTQVEASVTQERSISDRSPELQEARVGLTVTQSLLRGLGPAVNLVRVEQARLETIASEHELRGFTQALLASTEVAYWRFQLAQAEIAIFERSLELARQQLADIEQRIEVGVLAHTVAAAARTEVALREQQLIDARAGREAQRLQLLRLLNPSPTAEGLTPQVLAVSDPRLSAGPITDLDDRILLAQQARPDLQQALLELEQNRLETVLTRNGLLPQLDVFAALGKSGFDDRLDDSFSQLDGDDYDVTVGLSFSRALEQSRERGLDTAARAGRRQAALAVENLRQLIALEVRLAANEVERTRLRIHATATTRQLQQETVDAERERFQVGASTSLLVAQAQRDLLAAEIAEVESIVNHRVALVRLYEAEGSLLARRGIVATAP